MKTVGLIKYPFLKSSGLSGPPATKVAPSSIPLLIKLWILSNWTFEMTGPICSPDLLAKSTLILFASSAASFIALS